MLYSLTEFIPIVPEGLCWDTAFVKFEDERRTVQLTENSGNKELCTIKSATIEGSSVDIRFDTIGPSPRRPNPGVSPRTYDKGRDILTYGGADSLI